MNLKIFVIALAMSAQFAWADTTTSISLATTGTAVTQNFNGLPTSGTGTLASNTPNGVGFVETGSGLNTTITAGTGGSSTGDTYSFGAELAISPALAADRALGALQSGTVASTLGLRFVNSTGVTLTSVQISYVGEQWRLGAAGRVDRLDFQYQLGATSLTTGTWTDFNSLDFTAPITSGTLGALDGNSAANRTALAQSVTGLSIAPAAEFWVRWTDLNPTGADDGLGIDDFSITPIAPAALPVLSISGTTSNETSVLGTDTNFSFALNLTTPAPAGGVSGTFSTSDGSGADPANFAGASNAGGNDYAPQTNVAFTIAAGNSSASIIVPVRGDLTYEVDESFDVTLNAAGLTGATLGTSTAVATITNDDGLPTILASSPSVTEGTGVGTTTLTFELSLDGPTQRGCNFGYESFANADAQGGGVDFDNVPNTQIDLSGASQTASVNVNIIRDAILESNESFELDIFGEPFECNLPAGNPIGTIIDDDAAVAASVSVNDTSITEGNTGSSTLSFTVTRTNASLAQNVQASVTVVSATPGADYTVPTPNPQTLAFAIGELTKTVDVAIIGEFVWEANEALGLSLSLPTNGLTIADGTGIGTINNDDIPVINVSNASITEGDSGTAPMTFTLTAADPIAPPPRTPLDPNQINGGPLPGEITVSYRTSNGSATSVSDFLAVSSTVTMTPSQRTRSVVVQIVGDTTPEPTEQFTVETFDNFNFIVGQTGVGTIADNDAVAATATLQINSNQIQEGNSGTSNLQFTVTRSNATTAFSVPYTVANVATNASDFTLANGTLTFAVGGALEQTITALVNGDTTLEPNETFTVTLGAVTNVTGATQVTGNGDIGTGTIINDDVPLISIGNASAVEGAVMTVTLTLNEPAISAVNGVISTSPNGAIRATAGLDYIALLNVPFTIAAGASNATVNLTTLQDLIFEGPEVFDFAISSVNGANLAGATNSVGSITDNDAPPAISFNNVSLNEGTGGTNTEFPFTATLVGNTFERALNFAVTVGGGSATSGTDYNAVNSVNLPFLPGDTSAGFVVRVIPDFDIEANETFEISAAALAGAAASAVGRGTIVNDDISSVSVADASIIEGNGGSSLLSFTVTRTNASAAQSVQATVAVVSATPGADYTVPTPNPQTLTFAIGELTKNVEIAVIGELVWEANEAFGLNLTLPTNGLTISDGFGLGTINNDDTPVINISSASITEGNSGTAPMTFTLTAADPIGPPLRAQDEINGGPEPGEILVSFRTVNGSATSVSDFVAVNSTVTMTPSQRTRNVTVQIVGDLINEPTEQFTLETLSNLGFTIGQSGTGTILDNDSVISTSINDVSVLENAGTASLSVSLSEPSPAGGTRVDFTTDAGSAAAISDFTASSGTVTIAAGSSSAIVVIQIVNDALPESVENFIVRVSNVRTGGLFPVSYSISKPDGVVTINDDDTTIALAAAPSTLVFGQALVLTANVACGTSPTGTVSFANGATNLGSAALVSTGTGTARASLSLPLLNAGSYSVIASYTGVAPCVNAVSTAAAITVSPAATSLALSGPARSRISQPIAFSGALSVLAPGSGIPSGTVTLTSIGSASCSHNTPSASSCNLSWSTLGAKTINASFTASTGNYLASTSNAVNTFVFALADLDVSLTNQTSSYLANDILVYTLTLNNRGPNFAPGVRLRSQLPAGLFKVRWTCIAVAGAICPEAGGVSDINALVLTLPANGQLIYTLSGVVVTPTPLEIRATAAVTLPDDGSIEDPILTNQSATDTDSIDGVFKNGFED